jgi:type VI secretion system protein ImpA
MINLEVLLSETRESPPCGPNLEHDLAFFELEEAARGKPEQRVGDSVKPGEEPDWPKVRELAQGLLGRSKDLRLAVHLTRALIRTEGIAGLAAGLALVHGLLERYWDAVHPVLEADNDNDPTERINALAPLTDPETVIRDVRDADLVSSRKHGQLRVREVEVALGRLVPARSDGAPAVKPLSQVHAHIKAAFDEDRTMPAVLGDARARLHAIQALVSERVEGSGLELKPLAQSIDNLLEACDAALGTRAPGAGTTTTTTAAAGETAIPGVARALDLGDEIQSREQALRVLDLVCRYLERQEPSNPAPLLIRRAQRLMTKSFVEIVKDLMPESLSHLEGIAGDKLDQT